MASSHPFRNSLGTFCLCAIVLFSAAPGIAQDNNIRKLLKKAPVGYPYILKSKGIGGIVKLKVFIKPDGTVRDAEVVAATPFWRKARRNRCAMEVLIRQLGNGTGSFSDF